MKVPKPLPSNPTYVLAGVGLAGFCVDMFLKPISNSALILLGVACSPWLTRLITSAEIAGFKLALAPPAPPQSTGEKLAHEAAEAQEPPELAQEQHNDVIMGDAAEDGRQAPPAEPITGSGGSTFAPGQNLAAAYLLEGLVAEELQRELSGLIQRGVRLERPDGVTSEVDALIIRENETVVLEVKLFAKRPYRASLIEQAQSQTLRNVHTLVKMGHKYVRGIVAVVVSDREAALSFERSLAKSIPFSDRVQVRVFSASDLMAKYGFNS